MLVGENPFASASNLNQLFERIKSTDFTVPETVSPEAADLLRKLLVRDPAQRLGAESIQQIKSHPFFAGLDWTEMLKNKHRGPLNPRFDRDEVMLKALNVPLPGKNGDKNMQLKGFTYNENFQADSPNLNE